MFQSLGLPAPSITAGLVALIEIGGSILMLLGVAVELAGLTIIVDMVGAIATAHWKNGFDFAKGGWEHPATVLVIALAAVLAGAARHAVGRKTSA